MKSRNNSNDYQPSSQVYEFLRAYRHVKRYVAAHSRGEMAGLAKCQPTWVELEAISLFKEPREFVDRELDSD